MQGKGLSKCVSALFSDSSGLNLVGNNLFPLIFEVLQSTYFLKNALFVFGSCFARHYLHNFVKVFDIPSLG